MALSKVNFNSINVTPAASKAIKFNSSNNGLETGDLGGDLILLSTQTASNSATISFTSGIDSTYKEYIFKFINIHPVTDNVYFQMNFSADSGSNYNVAKTTTHFNAYHGEDGSGGSLAYATGNDLAQGTGVKYLTGSGLGNGNDESVSGSMHLFNPSSTTFVKHFFSNVSYYYFANEMGNTFTAGYGNTTSAIDAVQFTMSSGNIDSGTIKLYGVS